ncbi:MAG: PIN domain-containing protein [Chloroflexi bacterium]|nr:PIN domain-containing protein [Chloroflexota bacterium]
MNTVSPLIFVDTSAWLAWVNRNDPNHHRAGQHMETRPRLITSNFVIDETITLALKRMGHSSATRLGEVLWSGNRARIVYVSKSGSHSSATSIRLLIFPLLL